MSVFPYGEASLRGVLKSCPEDFVITEELGFEPSGQGEHRLLLVEKRDLTTQQLVERIARHYALKPRDIGFSGLKDKRAVTRQWFSLPASAAGPELPAAQDYRVLQQGLHARKLRRGTHRANDFEIRLREVRHFPERARTQLERIGLEGFANYFGEQRFGSRQDNVAQALRSLSNPRLPRWRRGLYLSALRSHLFNRILARRIELDLWLVVLQPNNCGCREPQKARIKWCGIPTRSAGKAQSIRCAHGAGSGMPFPRIAPKVGALGDAEPRLLGLSLRARR